MLVEVAELGPGVCYVCLPSHSSGVRGGFGTDDDCPSARGGAEDCRVSRDGATKMNPPPDRPRRRTIGQTLGRMGRTQAAFVVVSLLVVCAIAGGGVLTIVADALRSNDVDVDPEEFNADTRNEFIEDLRSTVEANPDEPSAMGLLANVLAQDGRIDEAITWYERSLAIDPANVQVRLSFALSLTEAGKQADAEIQYRRILENDPAQAEAHYYLGELYLTWIPPRPDDAISEFQRVSTLAPGSVIADRASESLSALGVASPSAATSVVSAAPPAPTQEG